MLTSVIAVLTALIYGLRYQASLHVSTKEWNRYWLKCVNLALCYRGFSPSRKLKPAYQAGKAAFCCCAYDVVTDWHNYDRSAFIWLTSVLNEKVPPYLTKIAVDLYAQECNDTLQVDGLSRGVSALEFVTGLIGSYEYTRSTLDFEKLGIVMQIVDDVLDLGHDQLNGETNCLLAPKSRRVLYLRTLVDFDLQRFKTLFPHAFVLCRVVRLAQTKAVSLLSC